jgi:uncharacterized protein (DUF427 family)
MPSDGPARIEPDPGQESVWDYPRPPRLEPVTMTVRVEFGGETIAETDHALRVLETSQPPAYYLPPEDVRDQLLRPTTKRTFCEWKGTASYASVVAGDHTAVDAAWTYPNPVDAFSALVDHWAFYAQMMDACWVGAERVAAMDGMFYGGWIIDSVVGPFKGGPGTAHW